MLREKNLQLLIDNCYNDLVFSLRASGLDVDANDWEPAVINRNAQKSAGILISVAIRHLRYWDVFLEAVVVGCRREPMLIETIDMIGTTFEHVGALPPLGIIQHTLYPDLLKAYCMDLANWLEKYLHNDPEAASLAPDSMLEYL